jgi:hypothetical protein
MPVYIALAVVLVLGLVAFLVLRKRSAAPPAENFVPIVTSLGGNTYATDNAGSITLIGEAGVFPLGKGGVVGSAAGCQAVISGSGVAARHAEISREGETFVVRGLNGATFSHNGKQSGEARIQGGDSLQFGAVSFKVQLS